MYCARGTHGMSLVPSPGHYDRPCGQQLNWGQNWWSASGGEAAICSGHVQPSLAPHFSCFDYFNSLMKASAALLPPFHILWIERSALLSMPIGTPVLWTKPLPSDPLGCCLTVTSAHAPTELLQAYDHAYEIIQCYRWLPMGTEILVQVSGWCSCACVYDLNAAACKV